MPDSVTLRIVLETPPARVDYALQKGKGSNDESVQAQRSDGGDLRFTFDVEVRSGDVPDFRGPFVQGPAGGRFVYIGIGTFASHEPSPWSRRLKVPLSGISREMIRDASGGKTVLEASVPGTGRDGTPACASVKGFTGWKVVAPGK